MPQKQKMKPLEKEKLVKRFECSEISLSEAAYQARVDRGTVRYWIALYRSEGSGCFAESKTIVCIVQNSSNRRSWPICAVKEAYKKSAKFSIFAQKTNLEPGLKCIIAAKGLETRCQEAAA